MPPWRMERRQGEASPGRPPTVADLYTHGTEPPWNAPRVRAPAGARGGQKK